MKGGFWQIKFAKKERVDKQYYIDFEISGKEVETLISMAKEFNSNLYDFIDKMTGKDADKYRDKLSKMLEID